MLVPDELWEHFKTHFFNRLRERPTSSKPDCPPSLAEAWKRQGGRTEYYKNHVLPGVGGQLDLELELEHCRVDFALSRSIATDKSNAQGLPNRYRVPLIWIESENQALTALQEIRSLCSVSGPLKVLISCTEWSDVWPHGGYREQLLAQWQWMIRSHASAWPQSGTFGVLIGEKSERHGIRFHVHSFDDRGERRDEGICTIGEA